ncbi:MAG TPA: NeuD/PglB/VioB family sugar acetyltransferase [Anaerolineales bacterium]|nr:NeuD/PglB/VioB family sugar acetyltransferase [Anaerolineales bacterium]
MIKSEILVPLLNANEPEARLASLHVKDGEAVEKGALLLTVETTKAATDIEAPEAGFVHFLAAEGDTLPVGAKIAVITEKAGEKVASLPRAAEPTKAEGDLRITKPARLLAESLGLDLARLPTDRLVTEAVVRELAGAPAIEISLSKSDRPYLAIFGAGGHAKAIMDMVRQLGEFAIAGIVDDNPRLTGSRTLDIPVLGTRAILPALFEQGVKLAANGVGGILDIAIRVRVFETLAGAGFAFPALVHPRATVEPSARVAEGVQVFANAYIGSEAVLGPKCMINTNAVVSHDCEIGEYTHVAPGALLAGHVHVGERSLIGMGVTTAIGVRIGAGVRIGNGAIVLADVPDRMVIQAGRFWVGKAETP